MTTRNRVRIVGQVVAALLALSGCVDEKIVYRDRDLFNPPADSANGFLGYFDASKKQTACGNCHVEKQGQWITTKHSTAWADLAASGHQQAVCNACHTVSEKGNATAAPAGYSAHPDSSYHDVQCESCHGPGFVHASSPSLTNIPLAKIAVSTDTSIWDASATCASCHSGTHQPFVEQWAQSAHAEVVETPIDEYVKNPAQYASCLACHEGRTVLKTWGVNTAYVEKNDAITLASAMPVTCAVCHDPHAKNHEGQLRWPIDDPNPDNNLCMKCHNRRADPTASSSRGPHAPQGGVLLGTAGWWPAGYDTNAVIATHGNPTKNPRLCAQCHVAMFAVNDPNTGTFVFQSVGHLFNPDPCLDGQGKPLADPSCKRPGDAGYVTNSRSFAGCSATGCHDAASAQSAFMANRSVIKNFADQLWVDTDGDQSLDAAPTDGGYLATVKQNMPSEFSTSDNKLTAAEGALFNVQLIGENRYANGDRSFGVHNPFLAQSLLSASIDAVKATYGLAPPPPAVQQLMDEVNERLLRARVKALVRTSSR